MWRAKSGTMPANEVKLPTITASESLDTMATLPISVSRHQQQPQHQPEKNSSAAKEKEAEAKAASKAHFVYHQIKR